MPENISIKSDELAAVARGQAVVEARQSWDGEARVLSASACVSAVPGEVFSQEARYLGKVTFDVLLLCGDRVECVTFSAEFSDKVTSPAIATGTNVILQPIVANVEATTDGGTIKAVAVIDTTVFAVKKGEYSCLAEPDGGIYAEKNSIAYCTLSAEQTETVYVSDGVTAGKAAEVAGCSARVAVTAAESVDGAVKVSGTVYFMTLLRDADGGLTAMRTATPFVKDIAAFGAGDGHSAYAYAQVTDCAASLVTDEDRLELSSTLCVNVLTFSPRTAEAVTDVFCADNEIEVKTAEIATCAIEPLRCVTDTVDGQISLPQDRPAADSVLCVNGTVCELSSVKIENGRVTVEGLVGGDIVYYNAENNVADTLAFRLPFSMPLGVSTDMTAVEATAAVSDVSVRIRRESVFDIKAEVVFTLRLYSENSCSAVSGVTVGEVIPRPDATVIVHVAKAGETLWQAAKALCCSPERVSAQNSASAPFEGGERLINFCTKA